MIYRAALIGCGKIGAESIGDRKSVGVSSHAEAYKLCSDTTLVAVCDVDEARANQAAERWDAPAWYTNVERMLKEQKPDLVSIAAPDAAHFDLVRAALATDGVRGVLAEKPLALRIEQARELVKLAHERGVTLAVNYTRRFTEGHQRLRDYLKTGGIGDLQTVSGTYTKGVIHNGTHWFDLVRFLIGEVVSVFGHDHLRESGDDPTLDAHLRFANGAGGCLLGCDAGRFSIFELDLIGTKGRVRIVDSGHAIEHYEADESPHYPGFRMLVPRERTAGKMTDAILHAVEDLVRCVRDKAVPICSGADGEAALRIALAVRESARLGCPIPVGNWASRETR